MPVHIVTGLKKAEQPAVFAVAFNNREISTNQPGANRLRTTGMNLSVLYTVNINPDLCSKGVALAYWTEGLIITPDNLDLMTPEDLKEFEEALESEKYD